MSSSSSTVELDMVKSEGSRARWFYLDVQAHDSDDDDDDDGEPMNKSTGGRRGIRRAN